MTDHEEIRTIEDALVHISETALNPEIAAPLIRKNLAQNMCSEYTFLFFKDSDGRMCMNAKVTPCYKPKYLGRLEGLS